VSNVGSGLRDDPNGDRMGLFPTASSLPAGQFLINDYELFFLQFGVGVTDRLQLSLLASVPVGGVFMSSLSAKYRYVDTPYVKLAGLLTGTVATAEARSSWAGWARASAWLPM
jgi:hypothetical protein